ncbi:helix-turn-helix transcriptional regulator [Levilactobacillus cerevisiae]|uniref:helix-turn-helix transcriptional regulator n=1 Tax=Levilactobacillus cerevisiae TaxID=1704076 RepID=UPI000F77C13A|nr:helix-turn-helix transcriptional regulator [Levilactobacillus cerevisiae]
MKLISIDEYADRLRKEDPDFDKGLAEAEMSLKVALAVKKLRHELGLTQKDFAKLVGKSTSTIARIETGFDKANSQTLIDIAVKTHKSLDFQFI